MSDRGFFLTWQAIRRQLAAMPHSLYLIRLIHHASRRAFPGERLWTATQLLSAATIAFLRLRNREGCDIYIHPYTEDRNSGYILLDLDAANPKALQMMQADGLDPCVLVQTSPGHLQAWLHLSPSPLEPALATAIARQLARTYGGDLASADWRHLGRLAGFTNQKPARRSSGGYAPWVRILYARAGLPVNVDRWLRPDGASLPPAPQTAAPIAPFPPAQDASDVAAAVPISQRQAIRIYQQCTRRWRISERFPQPDWSIVDLWVARALLAQGMVPAHVGTILQLASPGFPRRHANPHDYLQRTLAHAFSRRAPARTVCAISTAAPAPGQTRPRSATSAEN